eukprot:CAMPEP_0206520606 /NCGR_PEP_ID=MMETSP0324_2-20121206/65844_1 /ASSEMBLY_ACC=CAM_ASM_000836 /TAXON_ID=2866 /ORGANISM="Crypthecodinium cohnii, Strain Seligo" /LENGTH=54 /DNA_ID=CAMNT_0054014325 /DNA_START=452 /DNA_END=613 /DNA_ORIENTATION=+
MTAISIEEHHGFVVVKVNILLLIGVDVVRQHVLDLPACHVHPIGESTMRADPID